MREIREGDYVIVTKFTYDEDHKYFEIGKIYRVVHVLSRGFIYVDKIGLRLTPEQVVRIPNDNPVNRLLYPEVDWSKYV